MSLTYGFYNSLNGDRKYNARQMSTIFDSIINDGIFMSIGTSMIVTANTGMILTVGVGRAWFNHTWTDNDAQLPIIIEPGEVILHRFDAIVLEVNSSDEVRENSIKVIKGLPSSSPVKPTLISTDLIRQYPLCYIDVKAGVSVITQSNIENMVGTSQCPFVTGILETVNIDNLMLQWEDQWNNWKSGKQQDFTTWFETLEEVLDENVAGNLLNLINDKPDKSTTTNNTLFASDWIGEEAPYIQTLSVNGVTQLTTHQEIIPGKNITKEQDDALKSLDLHDGDQDTDTIVLEAWGEKPEIDIPIRIILRRDM